MAEEIHSFTDFPEDVQLCVLSFLSPAEITSFACTSKRFISLCRDDSKLWHSLCDRRWGSKTQIHKWGDGKISYRLLYRTLSKWEHLIGFWRRCGQSRQKHISPPSLLFFEWGPSFVSGSRVSPSRDGTYRVSKSPFLFMTLNPDAQVVNYINPDGTDADLKNAEDVDLIRVNVDFIGDTHFSVEENLSFGCGSSNSKGDEVDDASTTVESGSPGSMPGMSELYQYYANRTSPGAVRRQRRRDKARMWKRRWETEHFLKITDSSPTPDRPLQGLWKGICDDMSLEFYLVTYDGAGAGISCRRVGDLSERLSSCSPVFWTSNPTFIESPFSAEEASLYDGRIHIRPLSPVSDSQLKCPSMDDEVVSRIMNINSSYELVIPNLTETSAHPWRVEGRIWQYTNGTFGFGFLRDKFIVDMRHIAQNDHLLDTMVLGSD